MDQGYFYLIILFLKWLQDWLDFALAFLSGWTTKHGWQQESQEADTDYGKAAQVVRVLARGAFSVAESHQLKNFLYVHEKYVHPRHILAHNHISAHGCTQSHVFFAVTNPDVDLTECSKHPFIFISQYLLAEKLVIMPHWAIHKLANEEEVRDPCKDNEVVFIGNSGRCGSTLLCQMFNKLPDTIVLSEPWPAMHAQAWFYQRALDTKSYEKLVRSIVRLQLKPYKKKKGYSRIVIKYPMMSMPQFKLLSNVFPRAKFVFITKHPKASMISFCKFFQSGLFVLFEKFVKKDFWYVNTPLPYDDIRLQKLREEVFERRYETAPEEDHVFYYAGSIICYLKEKKLYSKLVIYEDLVENPEAVAKDLFKALNIQEDQVSLALTALDKHSQNKIFGDTTKQFPMMIDADGYRRVNQAFKLMGVDLSTDMTFEEFTDFLRNTQWQ